MPRKGYSKSYKSKVISNSKIAMKQGISLREFSKSIGLAEGTVSNWRCVAGVRSGRLGRRKKVDMPTVSKPIVRSGSSHVIGHDYTHHLVSIASSLRGLNLYVRILYILIATCAVFFILLQFVS